MKNTATVLQLYSLQSTATVLHEIGRITGTHWNNWQSKIPEKKILDFSEILFKSVGNDNNTVKCMFSSCLREMGSSTREEQNMDV